VGDILACSAERGLSYRWTNGAGVLTHGQTVIISQPGSFTYECSVFMDCGPGLNCPFSRNISGFARGIIDLHYFFLTSRIVMAALCNRGAIIFLPCDFYLSSIFMVALCNRADHIYFHPVVSFHLVLFFLA